MTAAEATPRNAEGGGYWDSGFYQTLDFFGDGSRIPLIVISPFSRGGKVVHSYNDHASVVKLIERNWDLKRLTRRSRDDLPIPRSMAPIHMCPRICRRSAICSPCSTSMRNVDHSGRG
jgi:hypothetical protein